MKKLLGTIFLVCALAFSGSVFADPGQPGHGGMDPIIDVELEPTPTPVINQQIDDPLPEILLDFWTMRLLLAEIGIAI